MQAGGSKTRFSFVLQVFFCILILAFFIFLFYHLCLNFISQFYIQRSDKLMRDGNYGLAISSLNKGLYFTSFHSGILKRLGKAHFKIGQVTHSEEKALFHFLRAKHCYLEAYSVDPLNSEISYGAAIQEMALERLYNSMFPGSNENPYDALPYFKRAIKLWPNSMVYNYEFSRYLYHCHKNTSELFSAITTLFMVYPPVYKHIKKDALWSPAVREAAKRGLGKAIKKDILRDEAYRTLSYVLSEEGDWEGALCQFKKMFSVQSHGGSSHDYMHLGYLYLKNRELPMAQTTFIKGLKISSHLEEDLRRLYNIYKREGYIEELYSFFDVVRRSFVFSSSIEVLTARSLMKLNRCNKAKAILMDLNQKRPEPEAYYLLARIAQAEEDWDNAEIAAHRATVLEEKKSEYHLLFSQILNRLKKFERAEKEAGLAIRYSTKPYPWLLDNRAWIRRKQKKYHMALRDWELAIKLSPEKAAYYARAAECHVIMGNYSIATDYYRRAVERDPENTDYQRRYREVKGFDKPENSDTTGNMYFDRNYFSCLSQ